MISNRNRGDGWRGGGSITDVCRRTTIRYRYPPPILLTPITYSVSLLCRPSNGPKAITTVATTAVVENNNSKKKERKKLQTYPDVR